MNSSHTTWQPTASVDTLRQRARIIQYIRQFFIEREVLEVETPALSHASVRDFHLRAFTTQFASPIDTGVSTLYLQTSPEFAMKRLLCAGSGPIFQLAKAFRNEEAGRLHNPEFTMLEWYRPGFDHFTLMDEVEALVLPLLQAASVKRLTYQQAFLQCLSVDPINATLHELQQCCHDWGYDELAREETDRDILLNLLFSQQVEPRISEQQPCFVYDFPASQAALARISSHNSQVAERFELYFKGVELANGFHELSEPQEQRRRFQADNRKRQQAGLPQIAIDELFLAALHHGLPPCAGVALGVDRLIMLVLGCQQVSEVLSFSYANA